MNIYNPNDDFVTLYENLRSQALNNVPENTQYGLGLSLFIQRGMVVWMKSWCTYRPEAIITPADQLNTKQIHPVSLNDEVVTVLVNMVLRHKKGVFHV